MVEGNNPLDEERKTPAFWKVMQLFVVPLSIVVVCVGIYSLFRFMTGTDTDPEKLLELIKTSDKHSRKIYLHEYVYNVLQISKEAGDNGELKKRLAEQTSGLIEYFMKSNEERTDEIHTLIKTLGLLKESRSQEFLVDILDRSDDRDIQTICLDALGALKNRDLEPIFKKYSENTDEIIRYHAVFNLASLEAKENEEYLREILHNDESNVVRINAALGLAYFYKDRAALRYLCNVLNTEDLAKILKVENEIQMRYVENAMLNIIESIYVIKDKACIDSLKNLIKDDSISTDIRNRASELIRLLEEQNGG